MAVKKVLRILFMYSLVLSLVASGFGGFTTTMVSAASPSITNGGGWFETAYVEWSTVSDAVGYNVYVKSASASDSQYKQIDTELIRSYGSYWRADAVGLAAGEYVMKVEAVLSDGLTVSTVSNTLNVAAHDRSGFAFSSNSTYGTGSGAYNEDGTLKAGAQVLYVTSQNAQTVTLDVITTSSGAKTTGVGIGNILNLRQKGYDKTPLAIRFIGKITNADLNGQLTSSGYLQVKGKSNYSKMNMTLEGIGEDTYAYGWGILLRYVGNVEVRNLGIALFPDDGISMDTGNVNVWIHHNDIFYGTAGGDADQAKGDGSTDLKGGSTYITLSYNHYWDAGKASLVGLNESAEFFVTFHHNWFDHSDSRHPRIRTGTVHVYNNFFDGISKYGVGVTTGSSSFVESNYFRNAKYPMMSSLQGTDALGQGTFSGENGGMIKAYNNKIVDAASLIYANSDAGTTPAHATSFDAYLASSRSETVPSSYKALSGGTTYNNFDTSIDLGVAISDIDDVSLVEQIVTAKAGRLNKGDLTWEFDDAVDDRSDSLNTALMSKIKNYKTQLVSVGGHSTPTEPTNPIDPTEPTEPTEPTDPGVGNVHNFTTDGKVSNFFTITGNLSTSKGIVTYNGLTLTQALKMESSTNVGFTTTVDSTLTLVFNTGDTSRVNIDGTNYAMEDGIVTVPLAPGSHTIKKADVANLYYMEVAVAGAIKPTDPTEPPPSNSVPAITSIVQPADQTVIQGNAITLPPTVTAVYNDGTQQDVAVTWDAVDTTKVGTVDVNGKVDGFAAGVTIKVTITAKTTAGPSTIWIIGDSTVSSFTDNYYYPRYGWGTQIGNYLDGSFTIKNIALSGRSSISYTADPEYQTLLSGMKSGDYLFIGFGHNDEKQEPERYTNPNGSYMDPGSFAHSLYENYIKPAQAAGTQVILNTPIVRRTATGVWSDSNLHITATGAYPGGDYAKAIRDLGAALQIPVVDLTTLTKTLYDQLGPAETLYLHAWTSSKPASVDNTHTNIWGAKYNAYLVTKAIKELGVSGLAEHVMDTTAPTKADTLISHPGYQEPSYTGKLPQSSLWPDYGIWKGTVFGDIGGNPSAANQTLETDSNGNMHIAVANNKGKIAGSTDGLAMYYYKVPADSSFTLTAKAKVNGFSLNDQVSFGLMARDEMYIDSSINTTMGDYVAAAPLKLTKAAMGGFWNSFARKSGVLTQGGTAVNPMAVGDTVDLRIASNSDGYAATFGKEATITGGFDFKLTSIDSDYVYVGMFVARNADITFSDIKLVVDGVEVTSEGTNPTTPDTDAPVTTAVTEPAQPDGTNGWYGQALTVSLTASDNLPGEVRTEFSLDEGTTWQSYTAPITLSQDGIYTLWYRSTDVAGNVEEANQIAFHLDSTGPSITVSGVTDDMLDHSMDIKSILEISDNLSGVDHSKTTVTLDAYELQQGTAIQLYTLPLGPHTLIVRAIDLAGNVSEQTITFHTSTSIISLQTLITRFKDEGWIENAGIANSLKSKLDANNLAAFVKEVQAQSGKHIDAQYANYLLRDAEYLLSRK